MFIILLGLVSFLKVASDIFPFVFMVSIVLRVTDGRHLNKGCLAPSLNIAAK